MSKGDDSVRNLGLRRRQEEASGQFEILEFVLLKEKKYLSWEIILKESSLTEIFWYIRESERTLLKTMWVGLQTLGWTHLHKKEKMRNLISLNSGKEVRTTKSYYWYSVQNIESKKESTVGFFFFSFLKFEMS